MSKRSKPAILVRKLAGTLEPIGAVDAETLDACKEGADFVLVPLSRRSNLQNRLYWGVLSQVVAATGRWPTSAHLHEDLLRACGYVEVRHDLSGKPYVRTDSTRFDAMTHQEFTTYFDAAIAKLSEAIGADPLMLLSGKAA